MAAWLSALCAGLPLPPGRYLVLISVRGWVDRRTIVRLEGLGQLKDPITSSGLEPATFRLVAWFLNQLRYGVPLFSENLAFMSSPTNDIFMNVSVALWLLLHCHSSFIPLLIQHVSALHDHPEVYLISCFSLSASYWNIYEIILEGLKINMKLSLQQYAYI
jgi:hypothetical protein